MNNLEQKIKDLSDAIKDTPEFKSFKKTSEVYGNDKEAQKLLEEFQSARQNLIILREGNFSGIEDQEKIYESLLDKVRKNKSINDWFKAQNSANELAGDIAKSLSKDLGVNFSPPQRKGCCG